MSATKIRIWSPKNKYFRFYDDLYDYARRHFMEFEVAGVVQRFSGFKDTEGVDVYEGDIVQLKNGRVFEIKWKEWGLVGDDGKYGQPLFTNKKDKCYCVVKGNIFEKDKLNLDLNKL